jgi:hypothetical protein
MGQVLLMFWKNVGRGSSIPMTAGCSLSAAISGIPDQTACKPGSVPARRQGMTIPLGRLLPGASRDRPGRRRGKPACRLPGYRPYLVLLPVGFAMPFPLPGPRCALTAPFHPYLPFARMPGHSARRSALCGTFPRVAPAGRYPAPCFPWSPDFPLPARRPGAVIRPSGPALRLGRWRGRVNRCRRLPAVRYGGGFPHPARRRPARAGNGAGRR